MNIIIISGRSPFDQTNKKMHFSKVVSMKISLISSLELLEQIIEI